MSDNVIHLSDRFPSELPWVVETRKGHEVAEASDQHSARLAARRICEEEGYSSLFIRPRDSGPAEVVYLGEALA